MREADLHVHAIGSGADEFAGIVHDDAVPVPPIHSIPPDLPSRAGSGFAPALFECRGWESASSWLHSRTWLWFVPHAHSAQPPPPSACCRTGTAGVVVVTTTGAAAASTSPMRPSHLGVR